MGNENRIEFYKNRSFGERLSAAADFLRQNWKIFLKNIMVPSIPFILLEAYFLPKYMEMVSALSLGDTDAFASDGWAVLIIIMFLSLYLYAVSGALMSLYEEGNLTNETKWSDLSSKMFSNAGKLFLIGLAVTLVIIVIATVIGFLFAGGGMVIGTLLIFVFMFVLIAAIPPLSMIIYPAFFQGESTWSSIQTGFSLGFKNWGSTFGILFVSGIMASIVSYALGTPYQLWILFNPSEIGVLTYVFAIFYALGSVLGAPFTFVFLAFQYFSITEKEEGISLKSKIDEFDNL